MWLWRQFKSTFSSRFCHSIIYYQYIWLRDGWGYFSKSCCPEMQPLAPWPPNISQHRSPGPQPITAKWWKPWDFSNRKSANPIIPNIIGQNPRIKSSLPKSKTTRNVVPCTRAFGRRHSTSCKWPFAHRGDLQKTHISTVTWYDLA